MRCTSSAPGLQSTEPSICRLPASSGCSCAGHWPQPVWLGSLLRHWHIRCRAHTHNITHKPCTPLCPTHMQAAPGPAGFSCPHLPGLCSTAP